MDELRLIFHKFIDAIMDFDALTPEDLKSMQGGYPSFSRFEAIPYGKKIGNLSCEIRRICRERAVKYEDGMIAHLSVIADVCYHRVILGITNPTDYDAIRVEAVGFAMKHSRHYLENDVKQFK